MRRFTIAIALFVLLLVAITSAQPAPTTSVPNLIRYGGTLKDAQGAPIASSTLGVTYAIYRQQDGGAPIWMETQNVTTDAAGNYSVLLGSTTATGLPGDLFSQQEQRWLGVQVQGQPEQPRVMMVSVPYAFKAHEADTLGGKSVSDFVLAATANSAANSGSTSQTAPGSVNNLGVSLSGSGNSNNTATMDGPTNFSGSTTDQIVGVTQSGTGVAINATADSKAIVGTATDPSATAYGVQGVATGTAGVGLIGTASSTTGFTYGLRGTSSSSSGTGVRGIAVATSGSTVGISGYVNSAAGTAGVLNNAAGGNILLGQNNGATKFTVDGSGDVTIAGNFTGSGTGITGIQFSQLSGSLQGQQLNGEYGNQITLSNGMNNLTGSFTGTYAGNGSGLMGVLPAAGSTNYIQNNNGSPQTGSSFNIDGFGTVGQLFSAYAITTATTYQIGGGPNSSVLSVGNNPGNSNVFLGIGAGGNYPQSGTQNTFSGYQAGYSNNGSSENTFTGDQAGYSTTFAQGNTFTGASAGSGNTTGSNNSYYGFNAGENNTTGMNNIALGAMTGGSNNTGSYNIYIGSPGQPNESNTIRIGASNQQSFAYMAGIFGNSPSGALPVVINANGQLGTGTSAGSGVTSWNSRTGAVVPQTGDYSFSMVSGSLANSQFSGTYSNAVSLSNTSNLYYGNGSNLTGIVPAAGSPYYIQNGTSQQSGASFNISGSGTAGGTLSANFLNTINSYQIDGNGVMSIGSLVDQNLFLGVGAGANNVAGKGQYNSFSGYQAGYSNNTGAFNTFSGSQAGYSNTTAFGNTFVGSQAGYVTTTGGANTFLGNQAGVSNTTGYTNVFTGSGAGQSNTTGNTNVFDGAAAGNANTIGYDNVFVGTYSGGSNISGIDNIFAGTSAGSFNTTGSQNVFSGAYAGYNNTTGSQNIFVGYYTGVENTTGSSDIYIATEGPVSGTESNTIRIGSQGISAGQQNTAYMAGIYGSSVDGNGIPAYVDDNGKLGTVVSSRRFKEQIADMGDSTSPLMKLRPVTFLYRPEYSKGDRTLQYGLIAEEVAEVYPELVAYDKDGQPFTVRYQYLVPMLLNEVQKQYRRAEQQSEIVTAQQAQIRAQQQEIEGLKQQLQLQNASLQERLSRLEKLADSQAQTVARK